MSNKGNILIADDDPSTRNILALILKEKGYRVTTARDGQEAVAYITKKHFDIVFMDIRMPTLNGLDAYVAIKDIDTEAKIFLMTASVIEEHTHKISQDGAYSIIYKPFDMEKIISLVNKSKQTKTPKHTK